MVTIVVLLILAGISIATLMGENGILTQAQRAKTTTEKAEAEERLKLALTDWTIAKNSGRDFESFLEEKKTSKEIDIWKKVSDGLYEMEVNGYVVQVDGDGKIIGEVQKAGPRPQVTRAGLRVGDYVNYEPDTAADVTYPESELDEYTGTTNNGTLNKDTLDWQILRIYDDGRMDLIGSPTTQLVYFYGAKGYNNGVYIMNDICERLYSRTGAGIKARSVNYEDDIEPWLTDEGRTIRDDNMASYVSRQSGGTSYIESVDQENKTVTYKKSYSYYPMLYAQENGSGINTTTVKTDGIAANKPYYEAGTLITGTAKGTAYDQADNLTVKQTYWYVSMNTRNFGDGSDTLRVGASSGYWVASRYALCGLTGQACFGFRTLWNNSLNGYYTFYSSSDGSSSSFCLRPVVSLGSSVQVESCTGTNSSTNKHTITQY